MRKVRRFLTVLLILAFTVSLFTGCGSGDAKKSNESSDTTAQTPATESSAQASTAEDAFKEHYEISIALWEIGDSFPEGKEDKLKDFIQEKFNLTIKPINLSWDDYVQKIQVWAASDQLPDAFAIDARTQTFYKSWVNQGVVKALPDDMSKYPKLDELLKMPDIAAYKDPNGKYYCIPRQAYTKLELYCADKGIKMRKDWMQNVGMPNNPQSWEEFTALMKAFAYNDPDQNGQDDTVGLTAWDRGFFLNLLLSSEIPNQSCGTNDFIKEDGKWIPAAFSKNMIPALKRLKTLWDSGGVDKDMAVLKTNEGEDKFYSGKAGAYSRASIFYPTEVDKFKKSFPGKKFSEVVTYLKPWAAPDGKTYRYESMTPWSETYFPAKLDDKKLERALTLFDWMISEEGQTYLHYGFEGTDYKMNGDKIEITRPKNEDGSFVLLYDLYPIVRTFTTMVNWDQDFQFLNDPSKDPDQKALEQEIMDYYQAADKVGISKNTDYRFKFFDIPSKNKDTMLVADEAMKAVMSDDAEKTWNEIIQSYLANGYDRIIQEYNDAAKTAGIN